VWGSLRRRRPLSDDWGFDRGLPLDRFYIESFLARYREEIRGRVLEVAEPLYTHQLGDARVTSSDVVDIDGGNELATIVADLAVPGSIPGESFDCVIVTQTLQYVDDPAAAVSNLWAGLAGGGTLLLTVPCLARIDPEQRPVDRWRFTPQGLDDLVRRRCPEGELELTGYGNVLAATGFLMGIAADELREAELEDYDPDFPVIAAARVHKRA
jgi:SAM-dependent methyltransferase